VRATANSLLLSASSGERRKPAASLSPCSRGGARMLARYVGAIDDPDPISEPPDERERPRRRRGERGGYGDGVLREARRERLIERSRANVERRRGGTARRGGAESTPPASAASSAIDEVRMSRSKSTGAGAARHQRRRGGHRRASSQADAQHYGSGTLSGSERIPQLNTQLLNSSGMGQASFGNRAQPAHLVSETTYFNGTKSLQRPHWSLADMSELSVSMWVFPTEQQEDRDRFYRKARPIGLQERLVSDGRLLSERENSDGPVLAKWRVLLQKGDDVTGEMTGRSGVHGAAPAAGATGCTPTLLWHPVSGKLRLCVTARNGHTVKVDSTTSVLAGQWSHVVFTIGRGELLLYVRGRCEAANRGGQLPVFNQAPLCIGGVADDAATAGFVGYLTQLQLLSGVLDMGTIQSLGYERPATPPRPDEWGQIDRYVDQKEIANGADRMVALEKARQQQALLAEQVEVRSQQRSDRAAAERHSDKRWAEEETVAYEASLRAEHDKQVRAREQERSARQESVEMAQMRQLTEREREMVEERSYAHRAAMASETDERERRVQHAKHVDDQRRYKESLDYCVAEKSTGRRIYHEEEREVERRKVALAAIEEQNEYQHGRARERQKQQEQQRLLDAQMAEVSRLKWLQGPRYGRPAQQHFNHEERQINKPMLQQMTPH
jgi:hypothetical protein